MRTIRISLLVLLIVVTALYGYTTLSERITGRNEAPVLHCESDTLDISVSDDESALFQGITATDDQDGDLTASIRISGLSKLITDDTAKVNYVVFDKDQNMATLTRYVHFTDYQSPRFSISEPLIYYKNETIELLDRLSATDVIDGDITDAVRVSSLIATSDAETYTVTVQVTNSMGDTAWLTLPVIQLDGVSIRPEVELRAYLVYLPQGSQFSASSYLVQVNTPEGSGDTDDVIIAGSVDTSTPGTYTVRYTYPYNSTSGSSILTVVVE